MWKPYLHIFNSCLQDIVDNNKLVLSPEYISDKYNIELEIAKSIQDEFLNIGINNSLFKKARVFEKPYYSPAYIDKFKCKEFLKSDGFKKYFDQKKSIKWYKRPEIIIPSFISLVTIFFSTATPLYIHTQQKHSDNKQKEEIKAIIDSVNKVYKTQYDSIAHKTDLVIFSKLDSLETLFYKYLDNTTPFNEKERKPIQ